MTEGYSSCVESDEGNVDPEFNKDFSEILADYPEVVDFIATLKDHIKWQKKKLCKLRKKLTLQKNLGRQTVPVTALEFSEKETQTHTLESSTEWDINGKQSGSISEQVKQVAESAIQQSGFVYEETSGLYYDYNSGYYYDAAQGLYYDGNSGTYYRYNEESKSYEFHSQTNLENTDKRDKRKAKSANKDDAKKNKRRHCEDDDEFDEPEEGECSNSDNSPCSQEVSSSSENEIDDEQDPKTHPPCMRIIVKETNLPKLKVGSLFVVTCMGGSLGREGDHPVIIPDINISKHHARFQYDEMKKSYEIIDLGSRNGTILNNKRLSVAKQESEPCEVLHGSIIQVGTTKLLCHIHTGHDTCGHCEPGLIQQQESGEGNIAPKISQHKSELRRLKNKFGVERDNTDTASQVASGYQDRAQARRVVVGSSTHHAKTQQSSVETSIAKDNKGFKLLSKMGWTEGQSLGKDGSGRTEPVPLVSNNSKVGLGATSADYPVVEVNPNLEKKQAVWRKTRKRYDGISQ